MDAFVGSIWCFGFNFPPYGWAECNGQLLAISQYQALYSLIGTIYGGNGQTTFAVPNMQGRVPIGTGQGLGLPNYVIGQTGGNETVTLTVGNLPAHNHPTLSVTTPVSNVAGTGNDPNNSYLAIGDSNVGNAYNSTASSGVHMAAIPPVNSGITGSNIPISVLSPFQVVNYCISFFGVYPVRN